MLTNAIETKVGSITAEWEHFFNWLRAEMKRKRSTAQQIREQGTSLEGCNRGFAAPAQIARLRGKLYSLLQGQPKDHRAEPPVHRRESAYERFLKREELQGKLGVFWHTQGSGKSFSMIFYARKIFRKQTGNFTFVVVTDRDDLDGQIYRNFLHTGTVTKTRGGAAQEQRGNAQLPWAEQAAGVYPDSEIPLGQGQGISDFRRAMTSS